MISILASLFLEHTVFLELAETQTAESLNYILIHPLKVMAFSTFTRRSPNGTRPNFSEFDKSVAELLQFKYMQFGRRRPSWVWPEVDFHNTGLRGPGLHQPTKFEQNRDIRRAFSRPVYLGGGEIVTRIFSEMGTKLNKSLRGYRGILDAPRICFRFHIQSSISKHGLLKEDLRPKIEAKFPIFSPRVKLGRVCLLYTSPSPRD